MKYFFGCLLVVLCCNSLDIFAQNCQFISKYNANYVELQHTTPIETAVYTKCGDPVGKLTITVSANVCSFAIEGQTQNIINVVPNGGEHKLKYKDPLGMVKTAIFYFDDKDKILYFTYQNDEKMYIYANEISNYNVIDNCNAKK
jgi:hypothetical protein